MAMGNHIAKGWLTGALLMTLAGAYAQTNVVDEVIWVVGDEPILLSDVEQSRLEAQSRGQQFAGDPFCVIPENLALEKLFLHQAAIDSIEVTDSEVLQNVEERVNYFTQIVGSKEKLEEYFGKTISQIREKLFETVRNEMLVSEVRRNLVADVKVTPAQVRRYFNEVPEDSIPFIPTRYEVQILVRDPVISQEEIDRVKEELRVYTERINSGEAQFSTLALLYSEDRGTAARGGECGFANRADFVPEFANVAFNLTDPTTVSKIVETEYGFHIIQLIEKRGDRINVRHILRKPNVSDDELTACVLQMDTIIQGIEAGDYTFDEAVTQASTDKDTRANYGIMVNKNADNPTMRTTRFELKDLPSEVAKVVVGMQVGDISRPFVMVNDKGKDVVAVVKLRSRVEGHRATMKDDYQEMQDVVVEMLSVEKVNKWIRDLQATTYVRINEEWRDCEFQYPGWIK